MVLQEAQKTEALIWWNVWILNLPLLALGFSSRLEKRSVGGGDDDVPDDENLVRFQLSGSSNRQGIPGPSKTHLRKPHEKAEKGLRRYRR